MSFADPLKEFCSVVFDWDREVLWGPSENRNRPDPRYPMPPCDWCNQSPHPELCKKCGGKLRYLTPRHALQTLGTEWGRACHEDIWAKLGVRRAKEWERCPYVQFDDGDTRPMDPPGIAVFTDCRFLNEARAIREAGGVIWRIVRPGAGLQGQAGAHASELEQDAIEADATISNVGSLSDLRRAVENLLEAPQRRHRGLSSSLGQHP